jgi:septal ring factor EnvC (AmiA/AmiB activator)
MNTVKSIAERIKQLEKDISSAETTIKIHEKRLGELKNQIADLETECKNELDLTVKQLPEFIKINEHKIDILLTELEVERDKINEGHEE